ncbi:rhomboid protease ROM4 [Babesia caballi]|uniref:Rhomboid-like protease n=1 Tax=Babesia caballi TaxID=5871 RepID=A0AAV4LSN7_BABCB|nr:rhomboid protease ROM4 [Babesia caballi]
MPSDDNRDNKGSDSASNKPPAGSYVKSIVQRGLFAKANRSSNTANDASQRRVEHPQDRAARTATPQETRDEQRERAKFLAEKYEKIVAARNEVESSTNRLPTPTPASASHVKKSADAKADTASTLAPSQRPLRSTATIHGPSGGLRVHTLADTAAADAETTKAPAFIGFPFSRMRSSSSQTTAQVAEPGGSRPSRPTCIIRRRITERVFPGKCTFMICSTILITVLFIYAVYLNRTTFNGRCFAKVDYSKRHNDLPFYSPLGYVACENNLKTTARERALIGRDASDNGFPNEFVYQGSQGGAHSAADGPSFRVAMLLGGLCANHIRIYGEYFRLFSTIFLHSGVRHLLFNSVMNLFCLYILEPDWGFLRTVFGYLFCGYSASLVHASMCPCFPAVGASGSIFAMIGALLPYCVEHWDALRTPLLLTFVSLSLILLELVNTQMGVSSHAHVVRSLPSQSTPPQGGYVFGLCFGFMTLKSVNLFDRGALLPRFLMQFFWWCLSEERKQLLQEKIAKAAVAEDVARMKYEQKAKANKDRLKWLKRAFGVYPYGSHRMRLRDIITRVVFLCLTVRYPSPAHMKIQVALFTYFLLATYSPAVYTKINQNTNFLFASACHCGFLKKSAKTELNRMKIGNLAGSYYCFQHKFLRDAYCEPAATPA